MKQAHNDSPEIIALKMAIERKSKISPRTPSQFERLSDIISTETHEPVSASTLKRLWGYVDYPHAPRLIILDTLARYLGVGCWDKFVASLTRDRESSMQIEAFTLRAADLNPGDVVALRWLPDRVVTIRLITGDEFEIIGSVGSKLCVGERFHASGFTAGSPATLYGLRSPGDPVATDYIAGINGGITWMFPE